MNPSISGVLHPGRLVLKWGDCHLVSSPSCKLLFLGISDLRCYGTSQKLKVEPCRRWSCLFSRLKTHMEPAKIWSEDISRTGDGIGRSCCESILTVIHLATKFTMIYETLETTIDTVARHNRGHTESILNKNLPGL